MGLKCFNCKKGVMYGHNVSHAKNRTRKIFKPNLHSAKIMVNGAFKRVKLCTKCQRKFKAQILDVKAKTQNLEVGDTTPQIAAV